jgi:hypothetical protein
MTSLGRLHQVELRQDWLSEPDHFTTYWPVGEEKADGTQEALSCGVLSKFLSGEVRVALIREGVA